MTPRKYLTIRGVSRCLRDWARQPGAVSVSSISDRLKRGMDPEAAVFGASAGVYSLEINGITDTIRWWARRPGARGTKAISLRIRAGCSPIDAVFYRRSDAPTAENPTPSRAPVVARGISTFPMGAVRSFPLDFLPVLRRVA